MKRIGIVGCGAVTELCHLPASQKSSAAKIVGLVDSQIARARGLAKKYGVEMAAEKTSDLYGKIDGVILAVPNQLHSPLTKDFLSQGIGVLVEKPMARSAAEGRYMIEAAEEHQTHLAVGLMYRHSRGAQLIRDALAGSWMGKLRKIEIEYGSPMEFWPKKSDYWVRRDDVGGGALLDYGSHSLDLLFTWTGKPETFEYQDDAMAGLETDCTIRFGTEAGVPGSVTYSHLRKLRNTARFTGSHWTVEYDMDTAASVRIQPSRSSANLPAFLSEPKNAFDQSFEDLFAAQLTQFADDLNTKKGPSESAWQSVEVLQFIEDCYGRRTPAEPEWFAYTGFSK